MKAWGVIRPWATFFVVLAVAMGSGPLASAEDGVGLLFKDVWARAAGEGHMSAVYMHVTNTGTEPVSIVAAHSDVAERVEIHETVMEVTVEGGRISQIMRMQEIDALDVEPGSEVVLAPGGLHIMLIGLTRAIEEGDSFTLELELADGRRVSLEVPVQVGLDDDDHDHHDH